MTHDARLARTLVLDELFDLSLYRALREGADGDLRKLLDELVPIETKHLAFWQSFFGLELTRLDWWRRVKLALILLACRVFGVAAIHLVLEAIEIHGVKKYLEIWEAYEGRPLGQAVRDVLNDELGHEDRVVSESIDVRIDPESVRNVFLGFNDGLVEILGAVSGFFAAFADARSILIASFTVAVAGAFSMAAGAYTGSSSEREVQRVDAGKRAFLEGARRPERQREASPVTAALIVGVTYFLGALVPVLPVALGARTIAAPIVAGVVATLVVSSILAFLSGMSLARRVLLNVALLAAAVAVTYGIGLATKAIWGISVS